MHERPLVRARAFFPLWKHPECHNMATRCAMQGAGIQCLPKGSARRGNVLPTSVSILRSERENERATWPWVRADRQVDGWVEGRASGRAGGRVCNSGGRAQAHARRIARSQVTASRDRLRKSGCLTSIDLNPKIDGAFRIASHSAASGACARALASSLVSMPPAPATGGRERA